MRACTLKNKTPSSGNRSTSCEWCEWWISSSTTAPATHCAEHAIHNT